MTVPREAAARASAGQLHRASGTPRAGGQLTRQRFHLGHHPSGNFRGRPGRGASASPSRPRCRTADAICGSVIADAQPGGDHAVRSTVRGQSTICARSTSRYGPAAARRRLQRRAIRSAEPVGIGTGRQRLLYQDHRVRGGPVVIRTAQARPVRLDRPRPATGSTTSLRQRLTALARDRCPSSPHRRALPRAFAYIVASPRRITLPLPLRFSLGQPCLPSTSPASDSYQTPSCPPAPSAPPRALAALAGLSSPTPPPGSPRHPRRIIGPDH